MPSLIDLRRRIRAVKNTQQITKAMKMVAASKLRRSQERIVNARPYASQMQRVLGNVAARVDPSIHPLLTVRSARPDSNTLLIVVTADKGLYVLPSLADSLDLPFDFPPTVALRAIASGAGGQLIVREGL